MSTLTKKPVFTVLALLVLCILFYCLDFWFRIAPSLVIYPLMQQYHTNALGIGEFASAFYLGYLLFQIPAGILLDNFSLRIVIVTAVLVCVLLFLGFVFATNFYLGWGLRLLIGMASGLSFIAVLFIARHYIAPGYFNLIAGLTIAIGTLSGSVIDTVSAWWMQFYTWHQVLCSVAVIGIIVAALLLMLKIHDHRREVTDLPSVKHVLPSCLFLLKQRTFVLNAIVGGLMYAPTSILAAVWGITFISQQYHDNLSHASAYIIYLFAGWAVGSPLVGWLNDRIADPSRLLMSAAMAATFLSVLILYCPLLVSGWLALAMLGLGLFSSAQASVWKVFSMVCPTRCTALGVALTNMLVTLCSVVLHYVVGLLLTGWHLHAAQRQTVRGQPLLPFHVGLAVIPGCFMISVLLLPVLRRSLARCSAQVSLR